MSELAERLPTGWMLIGGLMVQLHAIEHEIVDVHPTCEIDLLGQGWPCGALPAIDAAPSTNGFDLHDPDLDGTAIATSATESSWTCWRRLA